MIFEFDHQKSDSNKKKHGIDFDEAQYLWIDPERVIVPNKKKSIIAEEFDNRFDLVEDIVEYLEVDKSKRPGLKQRRVSVDFPAWMVQELDREAARLGITRQSVIKYWISEKLHPSAG